MATEIEQEVSIKMCHSYKIIPFLQIDFPHKPYSPFHSVYFLSLDITFNKSGGFFFGGKYFFHLLFDILLPFPSR